MRSTMKKIISNQGVKRPGSQMADASENEAKKRSRNPVEIPEDVWLDALKHLSCPKWSKIRLVSRQLNGVVERNVSRLPLAIIDNVAMKLRLINSTRRQKETKDKMVVSDSSISQDEQAQWFKDRGMTIDEPGDIQLNSAIIGVDLKENSCVDLCVLGPAQAGELIPYEKIQPWFLGQQFKTEVLFYAEVNPHRNKYSWASMTFFLKLLCDASTYVKNLSMYALDKEIKDILFSDEEERYIRCGSFTLQLAPDASVEDLCESVSWLAKNVQTDTIQFPKGIQYDESEICEAVTNYLLGSSWISASQVVKLEEINNAERFFAVLIKKFPTVAVQSIFPTVVFSGNEPLCWDSLNDQLSGKNRVKVKLEDSQDEIDPENSEGDSDSYGYNNRIHNRKNYLDGTYIVSNGSNQMRIEFIRLFPKQQPRRRGRWCGYTPRGRISRIPRNVGYRSE